MMALFSSVAVLTWGDSCDALYNDLTRFLTYIDDVNRRDSIY